MKKVKIPYAAITFSLLICIATKTLAVIIY
jgi:hypothetical protein